MTQRRPLMRVWVRVRCVPASHQNAPVTRAESLVRFDKLAIGAATGLVANPVAVGVVAAAAVGSRRRSPDSSSAYSSGAYRRCTAVATIPVAAIAAPIACAAHCDSAAAPRSSNGYSATAVGTATTPIGASASASFGIVWDQTGGEQNECCKSGKTITEHDRYLPTTSWEIAALSTREVDVDQRNRGQAKAAARPDEDRLRKGWCATGQPSNRIYGPR